MPSTPFFIPIIPHQDGGGLETPDGPPGGTIEEMAQPATLTGIIGLPTISPATVEAEVREGFKVRKQIFTYFAFILWILLTE